MALLNEINVKGVSHPIVTDDGYYSEMSVGDAEQLISSMYAEDSEPYGYRTTGGSADVGNREYIEAIVGGTVAWNQLVKNGNFEDSSLWRVNEGSVGYLTVSNGELTYTQTTDGANRVQSELYGDKKLNHKYLLSCQIKPSKDMKFQLVLVYNYADETRVKLASGGIWNNISGIVTSREDSNRSRKWISTPYSLSEGDSYIAKNFMLCDLTQMFGSTIADYIYSLEQATTGAGVAWFKKLFQKDYYPYNAGELLSVEGLQSHDTVGFNQWDEEWEVGSYGSDGLPIVSDDKIRTKNRISVKPSTAYYFKIGGSGNLIIFWYDDNDTVISYESTDNSVKTSPANAKYLRFRTNNYGTTYNHDICINLSWSGYRNGEYEPYGKHSYPLDSSLTLRGIPKLDASNNLYYDGDEYTSDGKVKRKYAEYTFTGSERWNWYEDSNQSLSFWHCSPLRYNGKKSDGYLCSNGIMTTVTNNTQVRIYSNYNTQISSSTNMNTLFTSGTKLVYELATPTTETAEPFQHIQIVDDFGTEEFVSTGIVPVGHKTRYPANLRDKLQHLPDLAEDDGYYMIGQSNKQMHLEPFRIPKAPTTDGTYVLKAAVSGGTPTYVWEGVNAESEGE